MNGTYIKRKNGEKGAALVIALMVLMLLTIMALGALFTATRSIEMSGGGRYNMQAFYVADAGINRVIVDMLDYYSRAYAFRGAGDDLNADNVDDVESSGGGVATNQMENLKDWISVTGKYIETFKDSSTDYYSPQTRCLGTWTGSTCMGMYYDLKMVRLNKYVKIMSMAKYNDDNDLTNDRVDAAIEFKLQVISGSICDNAIFGGSGAAGASINGSLNIYGGVTVLCDGKNPGDIGFNAGGSAAIYDNYDGENTGTDMSSDMASKMDPLDENEWGRQSLESKLQVQTCGVDASGSFNVGTEENPVDTVAVDGGGLDPADVFSVNGYTSGEGSFAKAVGEEAPPFPKLHAVDGSGNIDPTTFFTDTTDDSNPLGLGVSGDIASNPYSTPPTADWCNLDSATTGSPTTDLQYGPAGCTCVRDGVSTCSLCYFVPTTNKGKGLLISTTDTTFNLSGCSTPAIGNIEYKGKATMYYGNKNLAINHDVMVAAGESYPSTSGMGFMTAGDIEIGTAGGASQLKVMGLFYAQDEVVVGKQSQIAGIVVTNTFNVGQNVPDFFQVPGLEQNAPEGFGTMCKGNPRLDTGGWRLLY